MKRKFALFSLCLFSMILISGCSAKSNPKDIVGVWQRDNTNYDDSYDNVMQFNEDGTYLNAHLEPGTTWVENFPTNLSSQGTYTYDGNELRLFYSDKNEGGKCNLGGEKMNLKFYSFDSPSMTFYKTSDSFEKITGIAASNFQKTDAAATPSPSPSASNPTSETSGTFSGKEYKPGMYKIGVDMPSGEYVLLSESKASTYVEVSSDSSGNSIIDNDNFDSFNYVSVKDGEYLTLKGCSAYEESGVKNLVEFNGGVAMFGTFKVGKDIPAGEYKIKLINGSSSGYFEVNAAPVGSGDDIINNGMIEGDTYVTIEDGQYIKLKDCFISLN